MFVQVAEEGHESSVEVGSGKFEGEKGVSDWLQGVRLDDWPFFYAFGVLFGGKEQCNFVQFADGLAEETDFEDVEGIFGQVLFIGGAVNVAILQGVDKGLELQFGGRGEEDEGLFGGDHHDHFAVEGVQVFVVEDGGS